MFVDYSSKVTKSLIRSRASSLSSQSVRSLQNHQRSSRRRNAVGDGVIAVSNSNLSDSESAKQHLRRARSFSSPAHKVESVHATSPVQGIKSPSCPRSKTASEYSKGRSLSNKCDREVSVQSPITPRLQKFTARDDFESTRRTVRRWYDLEIEGSSRLLPVFRDGHHVPLIYIALRPSTGRQGAAMVALWRSASGLAFPRSLTWKAADRARRTLEQAQRQ